MPEEIFYCDQADVTGVGISEQKLIQLTDDNGTGQIEQENLDSCRRAATSMINGFAAVKYSSKLPFSPVPDAIRTIAAVLTKYFLYQRRSGVDEGIQKAYDDQISLLKRLADGTFKLEQDDAPVSEDTIQFTDKVPTDRAFHPDNLQGYFI